MNKQMNKKGAFPTGVLSVTPFIAVAVDGVLFLRFAMVHAFGFIGKCVLLSKKPSGRMCMNLFGKLHFVPNSVRQSMQARWESR